MTIYWLAFASFALISFLGLIYLQNLIHRQERELVSLKREMRTLTGNLSAQCDTGSGMNRRLNIIEGDMRQWREQMDEFQQIQQEWQQEREQEQAQRSQEQPYGEAIYLVHQGASVQRLMDELGLSRSEAELLYRVHGIRAAA
ncbi:MAG: DUF2802 domain-containing protein [Gammaproteobacteria bacterium SHHR-1]|uniref:DUF2802 domain-containing protein n=1 Tax=Magnetovirga frankeli TaxID=947516 RepID=UPI00129318DD|nr:DUF2802 domain-containing protein [gamma proteobacterium SS-5]